MEYVWSEENPLISGIMIKNPSLLQAEGPRFESVNAHLKSFNSNPIEAFLFCRFSRIPLFLYGDCMDFVWSDTIVRNVFCVKKY